MLFRTMLTTATLGAVGACGVVGPDFVKPQINLAERYAFAQTGALRSAAMDEWWRAYKDPALNELIRRALLQNLSMQAAQARIQEAEAQLMAAGPNSAVSGDISVASQVSIVEGGGSPTSASRATFTPSFALDLFGGQKRAQQQASATLMATIFDKAVARLAIQLSVVSTYLDLRYFEQALAIQRRSVANKQEVVDNLRLRIDAGDATQVELRRAEAELDLARAQIPDQVAGIRVAKLSLATLLAEQGGQIEKDVSRSKGQPAPAAGVRPGVPAELLRNRPDIRAAEARLEAAVAEIGVREADLYPSLRIGGTVTAASVSSVVLSPILSLPILDQPTRLARREAARARAKQAEIAWRQTVVDSLEEVQTALVRLEQADARTQALRKAETTYRSARRLSDEAFRLNSITLLDVLDTEDNLTSTQLQLAAAARSYARAWAELNVGIGQGWYPDTPMTEAAETAQLSE